MKHERSYAPYGLTSKTPESETTERASDKKKHHKTDDTDHQASRDKKHHTKNDKDKKKETKDTEDKKTQHHKHKKAADQKTKAMATSHEETLEAKQEKRSEIIERSLQLRKLYEETPMPRDPQVLARLMVADHILALDQQIKEPADPKTANKEYLLQAIDSMGELAEKLEYPESESTPEIQEAYEAVVQLAEDMLTEKEPLDAAIEENVAAGRLFAAKKDEPSNKQEKDSAESVSPYSAAALIGFIMRRRSQKVRSADPLSPSQTAPAVSAESSGGDVGSDIPFAPLSSSAPSRSLHQPESHLPHSLSPAEARAAYHEITRAEHKMPVRLGTPNRIASLAMISTLAPHSAPRENNVHAELASSSRAQSAPAAHYAELLRSPTQTDASSSMTHSMPSFETSSLSRPSGSLGQGNETTFVSGNRKLEHMDLHELLSMAEIVPVGHGERLRRAYERGLIDKDGLVKILKSRSKNKDYIQEYRQQVTRRKNLVKSSSEFLTPGSSDDDSPTPTTDNATSNDQPSAQHPQEPSILPFLPADLKKALSSATPPPTTGFNNPTPTTTPWLPIIGISLLIIAAGVLIYFLLLG